jgi:hypothetical protein
MLSTLIARLLRLPGELARISGPLLIAFAMLAALMVAGLWARDHIQHLDRYNLAFAEVSCPPPPGSARSDFLTEVQYLGGLPDRLALLDKDLPERLTDAFNRHPWVEYVRGVEVRGHAVQVQLQFRTPALVVAPYNRVVDRNGVLLPATAPTKGLPVLSASVKPPTGPAGTPWGDERVEAAARGAGLGRP